MADSGHIDMTDRRRHDQGQSPLIIGVILLVIGAGLLASNLGYELPVHLWRYWPFALVVPGLIGTFFPSRHLSRIGGVWLLATGVYGSFGMFRPFGLGWGGAWPVFLIAAGLTEILRDHRHRKAHGHSEPATASESDRSDPATRHH